MTTDKNQNGNSANGKLAKSSEPQVPASVQPAAQVPTAPLNSSTTPTSATNKLLYVTQSGAIRRDHQCDVSQQITLEELCKLLGVYVDPIIAPTLAQYGKQSIQNWLAYFRDSVVSLQSVIQAHVTQAVAAGVSPEMNEIAKQMQSNMFQYPTNYLGAHETIHGEPIFLPASPGEYITPGAVANAPLTLNTAAHST